MNNGKVRIYELSKELNLDNKDILDICEQLNIAAKSHSSTIGESEAERIRAAAAKYVPTHTHGATKGHGSPGDSNINQDPTQKPHKQEILAIHHRPSSEEGEQERGKSAQPVLVTPPRPPTKSPTATQGTPTTSPKSISSDTRKQELENDNIDMLEAPQLLKPPARQREAFELKSKPEPKVDKPELKTESKPQITSKIKKKVDGAPKSAETSDQKKVKSDKGEKKQLQPKLQRPNRPKSAQDAVPPKSLDVDLGEDTELEGEPELLEDADLLLAKNKAQPKLKRPNAPRSAKKQDWEEDDDEDGKDKVKGAKIPGKNKRRSQVLLEDDDELEEELSAMSLAASNVSISIARPAKPKSMMAAPAAPTAPQSRPKRGPVKGDGGSRGESKERKRDRKVVAERPTQIVLSGSLTLRELSELLQVAETEIIKTLFFKGIPVNITQTLDLDTAKLVATELEVEVLTPETISAATKSTEMIDVADLEKLQHRPPVVTIMGHVDHGKTTLLDSIRKTKVAQGEAGGITQHIGAYHVDIEHNGKEQQIVFLDTPGHEAFTAMRARGTKVTDIAVLVVAADDGVRPQTLEAISHAKAAEVPIVVAINKVDKPQAEPDRVKQELAEHGLLWEEWGGDTIMVAVSALTGANLDALLEMIVLVAEIEELSANPDRLAKGTVIEANLDRARGPVATLLVQNGTLRVGDIIVAGSVFGKIRAMIDDRGQKVEAATPSFAVEILGLNDVPAAGDEFDAFDNEREARLLADQRGETKRQSRLQSSMRDRRVTLSSLSAKAQEGELKELNLIVKSDVQGSLEAIMGALEQLPQNEVQIRVLLSAPGEVTETDVDLAAASGAVIIGFNTTLAPGARAAADREGVDIREYNIIYKLLDEIQGAMEGLLDPEEIEESLGQAEVRAVFAVGRGAVAGCYVQSGKIIRNRMMRVRRGNQIVHQGVLDSLKRMKEDAREVNAGYECGIGSDKFHDWQEGDIIEAYQMVLKRRTLSPN